MTYVAGMGVCDRKITLFILQTDKIEPCDENPGTDPC